LVSGLGLENFCCLFYFHNLSSPSTTTIADFVVEGLEDVIPLVAHLENLGDEQDLDEAYVTERYLLYVVCTRARAHPLITATKPASEFLDDIAKFS